MESCDEFTGSVLPGGHRFDKKLLCIKYPANVVNHEKAIECLGGIAEISETDKITKRRLELRFRPDDGYCKPACGDRHDTVGFLLRVRLKKSRKNKVEAESEASNNKESCVIDTKVNNSSCSNKNENNTDELDPDSINNLSETITNCSVSSQATFQTNNQKKELNKNIPPTFEKNKYDDLSEDTQYELPKLKVLGRIDTEFRFTSLNDFQYLPITKNKEDSTKDECIYEQIYPVGLPPFSWIKNEAPFFLPPAAFSRMDNMQSFTLKPDITSNDEPCVIGKTRKRRAGYSNFINFNTPDVPTSPPSGIETALKVKFLNMSHIEKMRQYFDARPIWSKSALLYVSKFSNEQMKVLLPAVAYYFVTGPWRITWVKLGYDPRKDPEARKYQILDYRLKAMHGLHSSVWCKRNYAEYSLPYKNTPNSKPKVQVLNPNTTEASATKKKMVLDDNVYIYRPGVIPPSRQMFYQYCDLHVKEIQDILEKYVGPPPGTPCHEKLGWFPTGFDELCREIINKQVRLELRKMMNVPENYPTTTVPRKRKVEPGMSSKVRKSKGIRKKPATQQPAAMSIIDDDDELMDSGDDEWEDVGDDVEDGASTCNSENETEIDDDS